MRAIEWVAGMLFVIALISTPALASGYILVDTHLNTSLSPGNEYLASFFHNLRFISGDSPLTEWNESLDSNIVTGVTNFNANFSDENAYFALTSGNYTLQAGNIDGVPANKSTVVNAYIILPGEFNATENIEMHFNKVENTTEPVVTVNLTYRGETYSFNATEKDQTLFSLFMEPFSDEIEKNIEQFDSLQSLHIDFLNDTQGIVSAENATQAKVTAYYTLDGETFQYATQMSVKDSAILDLLQQLFCEKFADEEYEFWSTKFIDMIFSGNDLTEILANLTVNGNETTYIYNENKGAIFSQFLEPFLDEIDGVRQIDSIDQIHINFLNDTQIEVPAINATQAKVTATYTLGGKTFQYEIEISKENDATTFNLILQPFLDEFADRGYDFDSIKFIDLRFLGEDITEVTSNLTSEDGETTYSFEELKGEKSLLELFLYPFCEEFEEAGLVGSDLMSTTFDSSGSSGGVDYSSSFTISAIKD